MKHRKTILQLSMGALFVVSLSPQYSDHVHLDDERKQRHTQSTTWRKKH